MKKMLFLYIFHLFFFGSCKKFTPPEYEPLYKIDSTYQYEIVWRVPLTEDTRYISADKPTICQNTAIFTAGNDIVGFDKFSGKRLWTYIGRADFSEFQKWGEDKIAFVSGGEVNIVSTNDGKLLYQTKTKGQIFNWLYPVDSNLFFTEEKGGLSNDSMMVMRIKADNLTQFDTIHTLRKGADKYAPSGCSFNTWINPEGDTILLFLNRKVNFSLPEEKTDLVVYNMTKKKEEYQLQDIESAGTSNIGQIIVDQANGKAYFRGSIHGFCLDLLAKRMIWSQYYPQGVLVSDMIFYDNRLFFGTNSGGMYSVYHETGQARWFNKDIHGNTENMVVDSLKKIIYFPCTGDGRLYAVNSDDGKILWREKGSTTYEDCDFAFTGIAADHQNRRLYVTDRYFAICIKMIE